MENYLTGRGGSANSALDDQETSPFRSYLEQESDAEPVASEAFEDSTPDPAPVGDTQVLYEEEEGPKVEVVSVDGRPVQIVVRLESGRRLELNCEY